MPKASVLSATTIMGRPVHAGAVVDIPEKLARQLAKDGTVDPNEDAVAYREEVGEAVISFMPDPAPPAA